MLPPKVHAHLNATEEAARYGAGHWQVGRPRSGMADYEIYYSYARQLFPETVELRKLPAGALKESHGYANGRGWDKDDGSLTNHTSVEQRQPRVW